MSTAALPPPRARLSALRMTQDRGSESSLRATLARRSMSYTPWLFSSEKSFGWIWVVFERGDAALLLSSASGVTIHGEMVVMNPLEWNGPSGGISYFWMSRADQSFRRTYPNMWSAAAVLASTVVPNSTGFERNAPSSISKSNCLVGWKVGLLWPSAG